MNIWAVIFVVFATMSTEMFLLNKNAADFVVTNFRDTIYCEDVEYRDGILSVEKPNGEKLDMKKNQAMAYRQDGILYELKTFSIADPNDKRFLPIVIESGKVQVVSSDVEIPGFSKYQGYGPYYYVYSGSRLLDQLTEKNYETTLRKYFRNNISLMKILAKRRSFRLTMFAMKRKYSKVYSYYYKDKQ